MKMDGPVKPPEPEASIFVDHCSSSSILTVVIPLRLTDQRIDALQRLLKHPGHDTDVPASVHFLVVDDGSPRAIAAEIQRACRAMNYSYLHLQSEDQVFSIGRCRNAGAMYARTDLILLQDIDLIPVVGFYRKLLTEIRIQRIRETATSFLMVPCIYLTQDGLTEFWDAPAFEQLQRFQHYALVGDKSRVERISSGTSVNVYNRRYFLARGGNDPAFAGWGYEDLEFNNRCINIDNKFPQPREWTLETGNFNDVVEYRGWKANYRLYGDLLWAKGVVLFHAWHSVEGDSAYLARAARNRRVFIEKLAGLALDAREPHPLPDCSRGLTLCFRRNTFTAHREVMPYFGRLVFEDEAAFKSLIDLKSYLDAHQIDRVLFHNPYDCEAMTNVYRWTKSLGVEYFVAERGALNGSFFFDNAGFLAESSTYARERWDRPLDEESRQRLLEYISREKSSSHALESQPERVTTQALRERLGLRPDDFVIFLALQRPGDTATKFMTRGDRTYDRFMEVLKELDRTLPAGVRVLVKKHPLEDDVPTFSNFIGVDEVHVSDLLDLCDSVLTFNSGVGVLAMIWRKFALLYGAAFYQIDGVNRYVDSAADVLDYCRGAVPPDDTLLERFLHYLRFEFYSIGDFVTKAVRMPSGDRMTATLDIKIRELRIPGFAPVEYRSPESAPCVDWDAPLFDRYRFAEMAASSLPVAWQAGGDGDRPRVEETECTAVVSPAIATAFAHPLPAGQFRVEPYTDYQPGAWVGYKTNTGTGHFTVDGISNRDVPYVPAGCQQGLRFRTVDGRDIQWSLVEFVIDPEELRVGQTYEFRGILSCQSKQRCHSGLYVHRSDGREPRCHVVGHVLDHRERMLRNEIAVTKDTFASMVRGTSAVFYLQFPGGAEMDLAIRYLAVYSTS